MSASQSLTMTHEVLFKNALEEICNNGLIPAGYGLTPEEWEGGEYALSEPIVFGQHRKEIIKELPGSVWLPCAVTWGQGLHVMELFCFHFSE